MERKKIIYVITKSNWGGAQRYVFDMATAASNRFDVAVVLGGTGPLYNKLIKANIRTIPLSNLSRDINVLSDVSVFFKLISIFKKEKADIVHLNSSKIGALGALAGMIAGVQNIIFTAHGFAFNESRPFFQKIILKCIYWLTFLFSHKIILVSNGLKKDIRHFPFVQQKMVVIKNGVATQTYLNREKAREIIAQKTTGLSTNGIWIGTVAELHPIKGLIYAIDAVKNIPTVSYIIVGDGELRSALAKKIKENSLENRVFLVGHIDEAQEYLKAFDLFLLPSLSEALSLSILEAGLAELPVIASAVGGIPEIIENEQTGLLVPPKNTKAITEAIEKMMTNETYRTTFGHNLKEKVARDFSKETMVGKTIALY